MWQRARETSPDDPTQAARAFQGMLEEAAQADATQEPGRETLVDTLGARDAASLGAGKWTRVLLEKQKPGPAGTGKPMAPPERATDAQHKPSAEELHSKLAAATEAGQRAAALLASSDPATIIEALRGLRGEGSGLVQKILNAAGGTIERILTNRPGAAAAENAAPASSDTASPDAASTASASTASASTTSASTTPASAETTSTSANPPAAPAPASAPAASAPAASAPAASAPAASAAKASTATAHADKVNRSSAPAATGSRPSTPGTPAKPSAPITPSSKPSRS